MKILNILYKQELQQIAINHSSDFDLKGVTNIYKKCTAKPYFVVITLPLDNPLYFRQNL